MVSRAQVVVVVVFTARRRHFPSRRRHGVVASSRGPALATSPVFVRARRGVAHARTPLERARHPPPRQGRTRRPGSLPTTPPSSVQACAEKLTPEARGFLAALDTAPLVVAQTAPAVRVALSEEFGRPPGAFSPGQLVAALRALGVHKVLDTNTAADLCCEEGTELLQRLYDAEEADQAARARRDETTRSADAETLAPPPRLRPASASPLPRLPPDVHVVLPRWIQLVEKTMPDLWPYVSSCKSPHMMLGALLKRVTRDVWGGHEPEDVFLVSVMPCVRKKASRFAPNTPPGRPRRRRGHHHARSRRALRLRGIDPGSLEPSAFDQPLGEGSGAGQLFGVTGGVMEAAVRTCTRW